MNETRKTGEASLRIHQSVARDLGIAILAGRHKPGEAFRGEIEASSQLKISRTAYREAVRILTAKGLLQSRPKAGTRVTPRSQWNLLDPDVLEWMFAGEPDEQFIRELFELRNIIEPAAAELAASRRTQDQLNVMKASLDEMRRFGLATAEGQSADRAFHATILAAAHNEPLGTLASSLSAAVQWTTRFKQRHRALPRDPLPDHVAVYREIENSNGQAARLKMAHLLALAMGDMNL